MEFLVCYLLPSSSTTSLSLAIKEGSSSRESKVMEGREVSRAEVLTPPRRMHSLLDLLTEEDKCDTVNPGLWPWAFIAHYLVSWNNVPGFLSDFMHSTSHAPLGNWIHWWRRMLIHFWVLHSQFNPGNPSPSSTWQRTKISYTISQYLMTCVKGWLQLYRHHDPVNWSREFPSQYQMYIYVYISDVSYWEDQNFISNSIQ